MLSGQPYMTLHSKYCGSENKSFHKKRTNDYSIITEKRKKGYERTFNPDS